MHLQVDLHFVPLFMDWILKTQTMQLDAVPVLTRVFFVGIKLKEGRMDKPFYSVQSLELSVLRYQGIKTNHVAFNSEFHEHNFVLVVPST